VICSKAPPNPRGPQGHRDLAVAVAAQLDTAARSRAALALAFGAQGPARLPPPAAKAETEAAAQRRGRAKEAAAHFASAARLEPLDAAVRLRTEQSSHRDAAPPAC
jgi:hypothetical protein